LTGSSSEFVRGAGVRVRGEGDLRPDTVRVAGAGASDGVDFSFVSTKAEGWTGGLYEVVGYCKTTRRVSSRIAPALELGKISVIKGLGVTLFMTLSRYRKSVHVQ